MRISRIRIQNFRNFHTLDLTLAHNTVIVGENKIGKTNLLYAVRLVLDPSLPDSARHLTNEDFWDGLPRPLSPEHRITVSVDLTDFEDDKNQVALLCEHLVDPEPMTARLTYVFQPLELSPPEDASSPDPDYEFLLYGGDRPENRLGFDIRRRLPLDLLQALRDAEGDIANWRRSPLRPLLDAVAARITQEELHQLAAEITAATASAAENDEVKKLVDAINGRLRTMVGPAHSLETALGFSPSDPERLLRALRLFIDAGRREMSSASLGSANVLYLTLKALGLDQATADQQRHHTFLAIEEPEAHLHPGAQADIAVILARLVRAGVRVIITTHSDWLLQEIGNLVLEGLLEDETDEPASWLLPEEIGVWHFQKDQPVKEIPFKPREGISPEDYEDVAEGLYNRSVNLQQRFEKKKGESERESS